MTTRHLSVIGGHRDDFGSTTRSDAYWLGPVLTATGLTLFFGYLTFRAFQATHVWYEPYISPTVAPPVFTPASGYEGAVPVEEAWLGAFPAWWPSFLPQTPAFFIPWLAIAFRFTCYYYRKAYYRAFAMSPPACAVRGVKREYRGETSLLIFQNLHRYALYGALFLLVCLWWEAIAAFFKQGEFGVGVGTLVMVMNATLLSGYSFRHLIGGRTDCMSCGEQTLSYKAWKGASWFNGKHMQWAWASLVWVAFTDVYIMLVSKGVITDLNTWG
jgi:hypothetical protein